MPKQRNQKQEIVEYYSLDQLEIAAADSGFTLFCENKKLKEPTFIQICLLKKFFEQYKKNINYECMDEMEIKGFDESKITNYLKKIFDLAYPEDSKPQDPIKINQEDLISTILLIKLQVLISNLDRKNDFEVTCKKIFVIMNRLLPYYPSQIRPYFDLENLFTYFKRMRIIYFKNLNRILLKKPDSELFEQMQTSYLCSMLMWVSNVKVIDFYLIVDVLLVLSNYSLVSFMFNDYILADKDIILILSFPLQIIDNVTKYYDVKTTKGKLKILDNIKNSFLEFQEKNSLQMSLRQEFINFMDRALDFALTTAKNRMFILMHYEKHKSLIDDIALMYCYKLRIFHLANEPSLLKKEIDQILFENPKEPFALILNQILLMKNKWQACIQENLQDFDKSEQTGLALSEHEALEIDAHNKALLEQAFQAPPSKKKIQNAQQFVKKELKHAEEKALEIKKSEAVNLAQFCSIDQYQNELIKKFSVISVAKKPELQELFNSKEQIILKEITKYLGLIPIEKLLDMDFLDEQEKCLFHLASKIREDDLHTLLLLYINLLDIFLSRIKYKMQIYKKQYTPSIEQMFNRHGQKYFTRKDHKLNKLIKENTQPSLDNLIATNDYCQCILKIFDIITLLRPNIKGNEFYKIWNLPINFRKDEYKDNYNKAAANLMQFQCYLEHKSQACKKLKIRKSKNTKTVSEVNENMISQELEKLMDAIYIIDDRINDLTHQSSTVFLTQEAQAREQKIQNTVIESNKIRVPIDYNSSEVLRRSQSYTDVYTKPLIFSLIENNLSPNIVSAYNDKHLTFFISESESKNNKKEEKSHLTATEGKRRMSM